MNFFQDIQRRLLLRYPMVWSTRVVPVLLTAGAFNLLLFLIFYLVANPIENDFSYVAWISFLVLCSVISVVVYLIYLLRFNYFKNFGVLRRFDFVFQFFLLFVSLGSIIAWPFMPKLAAHVSTAGKYSFAELQSDYEEAYKLAYQIEYTQATAPYRIVHIGISDSLDYNHEDRVNNRLTVPHEKDIDKDNYVKLERTSDSTFLGYERVNMICYGYDVGYYVGNSGSLTDDIYKSLPENHADNEKRLKRLNELFGKYIRNYDGNAYRASHFMNDDDYAAESEVCLKYRLKEMSDVIENIEQQMFKYDDWEMYLRTWFYLSFYASLFVLIFRYTTPRTFLWTLLFSFLLFVFTVIFSIIARPGEAGILMVVLFYYLVFTGFAVSILFTRTRNVFQGIGLILSFFFLHSVPLLFMSLVTEWQRIHDIADFMRVADMVGFVLVLISSLFLHSYLFYKWYSSPEN